MTANPLTQAVIDKIFAYEFPLSKEDVQLLSEFTESTTHLYTVPSCTDYFNKIRNWYNVHQDGDRIQRDDKDIIIHQKQWMMIYMHLLSSVFQSDRRRCGFNLDPDANLDYGKYIWRILHTVRPHDLRLNSNPLEVTIDELEQFQRIMFVDHDKANTFTGYLMITMAAFGAKGDKTPIGIQYMVIPVDTCADEFRMLGTYYASEKEDESESESMWADVKYIELCTVLLPPDHSERACGPQGCTLIQQRLLEW
jgi:hypothetical protein